MASGLQKLYIVRAVHGTTAIEGNPLSLQEVSRQLAKGRGAGIKDQVHRQTKNAADAFAWIEQHFTSPRSLLLEDLLAIHRLITTGSDEHENIPGRLRESGHNVYVRNRTHRLHYREMIRRCLEKKVAKRRRLLNEREARLLHAVLDASEPADPFSNEPAKEATWRDLRPMLGSLYSGKTYRTISREVMRLDELGFLTVTNYGSAGELLLRIRFDAIEKY